MQMIYNSPVYCVMEIAGFDSAPRGVKFSTSSPARQNCSQGSPSKRQPLTLPR